MSRHISAPISVQKRPDGIPVAFTWRGITYRGQVLSVWKLSTRWWETGREVDRTYYRFETREHEIFEMYRDDGQGGVWVLDICQD